MNRIQHGGQGIRAKFDKLIINTESQPFTGIHQGDMLICQKHDIRGFMPAYQYVATFKAPQAFIFPF